MQYTPSIPFIGGAAAIFGLKGAVTDYASPPLTVRIDARPGSSTITVASIAATANISTVGTIGAVRTLSTLAASVAGALPAGGDHHRRGCGCRRHGADAFGADSGRPAAGLHPDVRDQYRRAAVHRIASSVDLTAHQGPGSGGQAWGGNFIVEAEAGSNGSIHGIEIDVANFSASVGGFGVWLGNNGNQNMAAGLFVGPGVGGAGWQEGVESVSAVNDDLLSISSATNFGNDRGTHAVGSLYQGSYGTAILQGVNPNGSTPTTRALFTITRRAASSTVR